MSALGPLPIRLADGVTDPEAIVAGDFTRSGMTRLPPVDSADECVRR
jgi:hypothetical protein